MKVREMPCRPSRLTTAEEVSNTLVWLGDMFEPEDQPEDQPYVIDPITRKCYPRSKISTMYRLIKYADEAQRALHELNNETPFRLNPEAKSCATCGNANQGEWPSEGRGSSWTRCPAGIRVKELKYMFNADWFISEYPPTNCFSWKKLDSES